MHCFGYYGFYSNKSRGLRAKAEQVKHTQDTAEENTKEEINIIDVSKYKPKKVPSLTWCECIKKIWKQDPLVCPECKGLMKMIAFRGDRPRPAPEDGCPGDCVDTHRR